MQFKSPDSQVQSRPKRSTRQFQSPGLIIESGISAPDAQTKSPTLLALPVRPQTIVKQPTVPVQSQALIRHPTIHLPAAVPKQIPQQPARAVTQPVRIAFRVFAVCLTSIAVCANISNYGPLIPVLRSVLHVNDGQIGLFSTFLFLGIILANVPAGILVDRFGSRSVMLVALTLTTTGALLLPIFPVFIWMVALRMLIGLGAGTALVTCSYACAQLGRHEPFGQGMKGAATQLGSGLGLASTTLLHGLVGWRGALFVCGMLSLITLSVWLWYPKEVPSAAKSKHPADNPALAIRTPSIWMLGLANMGSFGLANAVMTWISVYFINLYGLPLVFAGSLGSAAVFGGIFFQLLGGLLLARLRKPVLLIRIGTVMCLLSVFVLALPFHLFYLSIVGLIFFSMGTTLPFAAIFSTASMAGKMSGAGIGIAQALVAMLALPAAITGAPLIGLILEHTGSFTAALVSIGLMFPTVAVTAAFSLGFVLKPTRRSSFAITDA